MAQDPLTKLTNTWNKRISDVQAQGLNPNLLTGIIRSDADKVKQGGTPLTKQEAQLAVNAAYGRQEVKPPSNSTNPLNFLGNAVKDIGDIGWNFLPGLVKFAWHLPSETHNTGTILADLFTNNYDNGVAKKYGLEPVGEQASTPAKFAAALRDVAKAPLISLVPGVTDAANLTSGPGRQELIKHPVTATLDVLPLAGKAASVLGRSGVLADRAATISEAADTAEAAGDLAQANKLTKRASKLQSVQDALTVAKKRSPRLETGEPVLNERGVPIKSRAEPIKALYRATPGLPELSHNIATRLGIDKETRQLQSFISVQHRSASVQTQQMANQLASDLDYEKMTPDQLATRYQDTINYGKPGYVVQDPVWQAKYRAYVDSLARQGIDEGVYHAHINPDGTAEIYPSDGPVAIADRRVTRAQDLLGKAQLKRDSVLSKLDEWSAKKESRRTNYLRNVGVSEEEFARMGKSGATIDETRLQLRHIVSTFRDNKDPQTWAVNVSSKDAPSVTIPGIGTVQEAKPTFIRNMKRMAGDNGLFAQLDQALANQDIRAASRNLTEIRGYLRNKSWDTVPNISELRRLTGDLKTHLQGIKSRTLKWESALTHEHQYALALSRHDANLARLQAKLDVASQYRDQVVSETPSKRWFPVLQNEMTNAIAKLAQDKFGQVPQPVLDRINMGMYEDVFGNTPEGKRALSDLMDDTVKLHEQLHQLGLNPAYIHTPSLDRVDNLLHPRIFTSKISEPSQFREAVFNVHHSVNDIMMGVVDAGRQVIERDHAIAVANYLDPLTKSAEDVRAEAIRELTIRDPKLRPGILPEHYVQKFIDKNYAEYNPEKYGITRADLKMLPGETRYLPRNLVKSLDTFYPDQGPLSTIRKAYQSPLRVWRFSVLAGPRHLTHMTVSGLAFQMIEEPGILPSWERIKNAAAMARNHGEGMPVGLSRPIEATTYDDLIQLSAGKSIGNLVKKSGTFMIRAGEFMSNMEKSMTYLYGEKIGLDTGMSKAAAEQAGLELANKIHINMDSMTPLERQVIRNVFPFWAFQKQLFKVLLTYPSDHPIRASIMAHLSTQLREEWDNGLPEQFQQYFFTGNLGKDSSITGIDAHSLNPFRSFGNQFTLAGLLSGSNPFISVTAEALGINSLDAVPELYPGMTYNAQTGKMEATRPGGQWSKLLNTFVPQTGLISDYMDKAYQLRQAQSGNRYNTIDQVMRLLNMPFQPRTIDLAKTRADTETNIYKVSQQWVSDALASGDFGKLSRFNLVPFRGTMVTPQWLAQFYSYYSGKAPKGINPRTLLPKSTKELERAVNGIQLSSAGNNN